MIHCWLISSKYAYDSCLFMTIILRFHSPFPCSTVVNQYYEAQVYDVFVIRGNTALFKCQIPSFVADHVEIIEWTATDGTSFKKDETFGNFFTWIIALLLVAVAYFPSIQFAFVWRFWCSVFIFVRFNNGVMIILRVKSICCHVVVEMLGITIT